MSANFQQKQETVELATGGFSKHIATAIEIGVRGFSYLSNAFRKRSQTTRFAAGKTNRLSSDWITSQLSSDEQLRQYLQRIIDRSRSLESDFDYYEAYLGQAEQNIIGSTGMKLQMRVESKPGELDQRINKAIEKAWKDFGKKQNYLTTKEGTMLDMDRLAIRSIARDGAILFRVYQGAAADNAYGYALQPLEIDHLDVDYNHKFGENYIRMGIEKTPAGKVVAYHILHSHPGDSTYLRNSRHYERVPADEIIHPFVSKRIGQTRGYPWLVSAFMGIRQLQGYIEAELVAARVSAQKLGFFKSKDGSAYAGDQYDEQGNIINQDQAGPEVSGEPGTFHDLGNFDFQGWDPQHPVQAFGDFVKENLRGLASAGGVAYHNITGDMEGVNYSSARVAELKEREMWKMLQCWYADNVKTLIFEKWLTSALAMGAIKTDRGRVLRLSDNDALNKPQWFGRRWSWVDPQKETQAAILQIENGLSSPARVLAERGFDEAEIYEEINATKEARIEALEGMSAEPPAPAPTEAAAPQPAEVDNLEES